MNILCAFLAILTALLFSPPSGECLNNLDGTIQDSNRSCTMKLTEQEEGTYLVGIICEKRKILSYWICPEVTERTDFSPYECREKETQSVDAEQGTHKASQGRLMRVFAPSIDRVPYVLCGRLCDPTN